MTEFGPGGINEYIDQSSTGAELVHVAGSDAQRYPQHMDREVFDATCDVANQAGYNEWLSMHSQGYSGVLDHVIGAVKEEWLTPIPTGRVAAFRDAAGKTYGDEAPELVSTMRVVESHPSNDHHITYNGDGNAFVDTGMRILLGAVDVHPDIVTVLDLPVRLMPGRGEDGSIVDPTTMHLRIGDELGGVSIYDSGMSTRASQELSMFVAPRIVAAAAGELDDAVNPPLPYAAQFLTAEGIPETTGDWRDTARKFDPTNTGQPQQTEMYPADKLESTPLVQVPAVLKKRFGRLIRR